MSTIDASALQARGDGGERSDEPIAELVARMFGRPEAAQVFKQARGMAPAAAASHLYCALV